MSFRRCPHMGFSSTCCAVVQRFCADVPHRFSSVTLQSSARVLEQGEERRGMCPPPGVVFTWMASPSQTSSTERKPETQKTNFKHRLLLAHLLSSSPGRTRDVSKGGGLDAFKTPVEGPTQCLEQDVFLSQIKTTGSGRIFTFLWIQLLFRGLWLSLWLNKNKLQEAAGEHLTFVLNRQKYDYRPKCYRFISQK